MGYARSLFRNFERYLRIVVGLDENDIQIILKHYNEKFITYQLSPGIYTIEHISNAVYTMGDHQGSLRIEYDDDNDSVKTKPNLPRLRLTFGTLRFDEKSFFNTLLVSHYIGIINLQTLIMAILQVYTLMMKF